SVRHISKPISYFKIHLLSGISGGQLTFGAIAAIQDASLADSGIVGDRGELYLSGLPEKGQVTLSWGENASTKCIFNYSLSTPESESGLIEQGVTCH
ncbi:FimD/PapC C-terminal domain-containing protein, partial [Escherichia coli]